MILRLAAARRAVRSSHAALRAAAQREREHQTPTREMGRPARRIMRAEIARLVYPVIACGLNVKERLARGDDLDVSMEQMNLKTLLLSRQQCSNGPTLGATAAATSSACATLGLLAGRDFILDSSWSEVWKARQLGACAVRHQRSGLEVLEQADRAGVRQMVLETFYLCMLLGFRGNYVDDPVCLADYRRTGEGVPACATEGAGTACAHPGRPRTCGPCTAASAFKR